MILIQPVTLVLEAPVLVAGISTKNWMAKLGYPDCLCLSDEAGNNGRTVTFQVMPHPKTIKRSEDLTAWLTSLEKTLTNALMKNQILLGSYICTNTCGVVEITGEKSLTFEKLE